MNMVENPELWRMILGDMRSEKLISWSLLWHLYAQSCNSLTAAQLARRLHVPEDGVIRLMNAMGMDVAEQTGWFEVPEKDDGWQIYFTRNLNPEGEWVYSIKDKFLPILSTFRK